MMPSDDLDLSRLPAMARELAETVGLPKALRLVQTLGGTTFPVPQRRSKSGEQRFADLADIVGVSAAEALVHRYGATDLYVPRCAVALRRARDAGICREYDRLVKTMSGNAAVARLARANHLSDRRIYDILKTPSEPAAAQQALPQE